MTKKEYLKWREEVGFKFPGDWIAPGERTYDSTGELWTAGPYFKEGSGFRIRLARRILFIVAWLRKNWMGYPPLWWCRDFDDDWKCLRCDLGHTAVDFGDLRWDTVNTKSSLD